MAFINTKSLGELQEEERKIREAPEAKPQLDMTRLAVFLREQWDKARHAKEQSIQEKMYRNVRMHRMEYDPEKLVAIKQLGGAETYLPIVNIKCRAAEAWINDIVFQPNQLPWDIDPTPKADLPPEIMEEIINRATQASSDLITSTMMQAEATGQIIDSNVMMSMLKDSLDKIKEEKEREILNTSRKQADAVVKEIDDVFSEGNFYNALREVIHDIPIFQAAVLKGPVYQMSHEYSFASGTLQIEDKIIQKYHRVNPLDVYPAPYASNTEDGYIIERVRFSPKELSELKAVDGFDSAAIDRVLDFAKDKGWREWTTVDSSRVLTENKSLDSLTNSDIIEGLEFWGPVRGELLMEWGLASEGIKSNDYYEAAVWLINNEVIKAMLNPDPRQKKPYSKACFIEIPGAFWGMAVPDVLDHIQTACNAVARASVNNAAIASGPMVERNRDRVPGYESKAIAPWKVFDSTESQMSSNAPAYRFYQPTMVVDKLMMILDRYMKMADETSGIPAYAHGDLTVGGAGRTASGLQSLTANAARGIKDVVRNIDRGIIESCVDKQYNFYLSTLEDFSEIPDSKIVAKGSINITKKEQDAMRKNEFLQAIFSPLGAQVLGSDPLRYMVREVAKEHGIDDYELLDKAGANAVLMGTVMPQGMGVGGSVPAESHEQNPAVSGTDVNMGASENGQ